MRNQLRSLFFLALAITLVACQSALEPTTVTNRTIRVRAISNTEKPVEGVQISFFNDLEHLEQIDVTKTTDNTGVVEMKIPIPAYGHMYSIMAERGVGPNNNAAFQRTIDRFLKCEDATVPFFIDGLQGDTVSIVDCTDTWRDLTVTMHSCPNDSVRKSIMLLNGCATNQTYSLPAVPVPFRMQVNTSGTFTAGSLTLEPNQRAILNITYSPRTQARDTSVVLDIAGGGGGGIRMTLVGNPRTDCDNSLQQLDCNLLADQPEQLFDFGLVCIDDETDQYCTRFVNSGTENLRVDLPSVPAPFTMIVRDGNGGLVQGSGFVLRAGEAITICVTAKPTERKEYDELVTLALTCPTNAQTAKFPIRMKADAILCSKCECPRTTSTEYEIVERVEVGNTKDVDVTLFTNENECEIEVTLDRSWETAEWKMISSALTERLAAGASMSRRFRYAPTRARESRVRIPLKLKLLPEGKLCDAEAILIANACNDTCYKLEIEPTSINRGKNRQFDTVMLKEEGSETVQVSYPDYVGESREECFTLSNPDSACRDMQVNVKEPPSEEFSVSPNGIVTIPPGESREFCVKFTSPDIQTVRDRGNKLIYDDRFDFSANGCSNTYNLHAVVDTFQHCKVDRKLTDYDQTSTQQRTPLHEVYEFSTNNVQPQVGGNGSLPNAYDLYHLDADVLAIVPKSNRPRGLFKIPNDPLFADFCNKSQAVLNKYKKQLPGFSYSNTVSVSKGDVIAVRLDTNSYALLLVTFSGGTDFNDLDFVHFVVIHPVQP